MKKLFLTLIAIFFISGEIYSHPLHISIINISIEGKSISITINTYVDDWETSYFHYYSKQIDLSIRENYEGEWFTNSIKESWQIREKIDGTPLVFLTDTIFFNDLSMTIEMHGELQKKPKSLYIYNSILTDIFPDQTNLVIVSLDNKQTGMKFDYKTKREELKLK